MKRTKQNAVRSTREARGLSQIQRAAVTGRFMWLSHPSTAALRGLSRGWVQRYDLVLPLEARDDARVQRTLGALSSSGFRRELAGLGYDTSKCGAPVAEMRAA